jgi:hypothetical protein
MTKFIKDGSILRTYFDVILDIMRDKILKQDGEELIMEPIVLIKEKKINKPVEPSKRYNKGTQQCIYCHKFLNARTILYTHPYTCKKRK